MRMWKKSIWITVILICCLAFMLPMEVRAEETADFWKEMSLDEAQESFRNLFPEYQFDGKQVLSLITKGKILEALKLLLSGLLDTVKAQIGEIKGLFVMILILGITAALFSNFADVFQSHQVSDIAFYFVYLLLIAVLLKVFVNASDVVKEMLNQLTTFMQLFVPAYLLAVMTAAGAVSASAYYQLFLVIVYLLEKCYLAILLPMIYSFVLLSIINGIWMEEKLNLLLDFMQKIIEGCVKITIGIITGVGVLQSMISPIIDALDSTALKKVTSVIPGIGNLTEGMFEMVIGSAVLIKNSIGVFITVVMLFVCALPILKILLLSGTLKIGAALIGIISDKRMTNCANRVGDGSLMLLKVALSAIGLFLISIALIASSTNRGL